MSACEHGLPKRVAGVEQLKREQEAPFPLAGARAAQRRVLWAVPQVAPPAGRTLDGNV